MNRRELPEEVSIAEKSEIETIDQTWKKNRENEVIKRLLAGENLQEIVESMPGFTESFRELDTIDCSDGRVLDGHKVGIAGSGILLHENDRAIFVERYRGKYKVLSAHADCGAAAEKFKTLRPQDIPEGVTTADEYGIYCGKQMAHDLDAKFKFLDRDEMASKNHNEVALVLDQTAMFDSTNLDNFPPHFVSTGAGLGLSPAYMKNEMEILTGIAMGHHGFGAERFTAENPFYVIIAANNLHEFVRWEEIAKEAVSKFGDSVVVKGFIRPDSAENN